MQAATAGIASAQGPWPPSNVQFDVGVNYHATSPDFINTGFIRRYHDPAVRAEVVAQLRTMANTGVATVKTTLWQVGAGPESWRLSFPLSEQQLTNIQAYANDVAATPRPGGGYLWLQLTLAWLGCADYTSGTPATTVGFCQYPWSTFVQRAKSSMTGLLQRVAVVRRPDGLQVVNKVYMELEVMIGAKANQDSFLQALYPYFLALASQLGLNGSVYFQAVGSEWEVFDNTFRDPTYPVLNGHRSMYWVYRSVRYLASQGFAIPQRIDFSFYPEPQSVSYSQMVNRVRDDFAAVFPGYRAGLAETYYIDPPARQLLGQALASSYLERGIPDAIAFWPTPYVGILPSGPPFDVSAYLLKVPSGTHKISVAPNPCVVPAGQTSCAPTLTWSTTGNSAAAAVWIRRASGGKPTLVSCGKTGQGVLSGLLPNTDYTISLHATPWCDTNTSTESGLSVMTASINTCQFSLVPASSGTLPAAAGSATVSISAANWCSWTATTSNAWINLPAKGKGSGKITYTVNGNPGPARTGTFAVGGKSYAVFQAGAAACAYVLSPTSSGTLPATGASRSISITAGAGCSWTASSTIDFLRVSGSGTGSGTVNYSVTPNLGGARSGVIKVAGQTFTVTQAPKP